MSKTFRDWVTEGEAIYTAAYKEYQALLAQIEQLEARLAEKKTEVNQIAQMIGKPPVEGPARVTAEIVEQPPSVSIGSVTRALMGRGVTPR